MFEFTKAEVARLMTEHMTITIREEDVYEVESGICPGDFEGARLHKPHGVGHALVNVRTSIPGEDVITRTFKLIDRLTELETTPRQPDDFVIQPLERLHDGMLVEFVYGDPHVWLDNG